MKNIKKYIPLIIIAAFFVCIIGYFGVTQMKDVVPGKSADGKDVVFSIDNTNYTADQLYDDMYDSLGLQSVYYLFQRAVAAQSEETTDEMKANAKTNADALIASWQSEQGEAYLDNLNKTLQGYGYSGANDLEQFYIDQTKLQDIVYNYIDAHGEETFNTLADTNKTRIVSHILVMCEDPENPTDEEKAKMAEIDNALLTRDFADVAKEYSDDSSAENGGSLGIVNSSTSFVPEFLEAALALNEGEVTPTWIKTQYGYHLIKCDASTWSTFSQSPDYSVDTLLEADSSLQYKALFAKADELGYKFTDSAVEAELKEALGLTTAEATPEATTEPEASADTTSPEPSASAAAE